MADEPQWTFQSKGKVPPQKKCLVADCLLQLNAQVLHLNPEVYKLAPSSQLHPPPRQADSSVLKLF